MASNSLITSEFSGVPVTGIAFTNISLDKPVLKYQPLSGTSSETVTPLPLDATSRPSTIEWIDETYFVVLYDNKPYFELMNSNDISRIYQHVDLVISSQPASCSCSVFDRKRRVLYFLDTSNRLYTYSFDSTAESVLEETSNFVVTELNESVSKIALHPSDDDKLLLLSNTMYEFNLESKQVERSINLFVEKVNCYDLIDNTIVVSSNNDRFINLVDLIQFKVQTIFVLNAPIVKFIITKYKNKSILAAIDQDGFVEIFKEPLAAQNTEASMTPNSKRRRRNANKMVASIQPTSTIKLVNEQKSFSKIDNIIFDHDQLTIAYLQNEIYFITDKFNWFINKFDQPELTILRKKGSLDSLKLRTEDKASLKTYNENNQVTIRTGDNFIDLDPVLDQAETTKGEEDEEDEEDNGDDFSTLVSRLDKSTNQLGTKLPSLLRNGTKHNESNKFRFKVGTLTTNLSQALRNNDNAMFDVIINNTTDENIVRSTVSQLEQHFVLKMLDKLAELVYKNKFKNTTEGAEYGMGNASIGLTTWIRYVLIYHGTYLIGAAGGNGDLRRRLGLLGMSLERRASNMNRLLELKGRLSMVTVKVAVTRELENLGTNGQPEYDEDDVEYIEDEEDAPMDDENSEDELVEEEEIGEDDEEEDDQDEDEDNEERVEE
ncbi:hypothetical protein PMKS-001024 [Pichia membranifaciens]|uniref:Small-subunit processome Utp12 domain-containing protein n=1 Tax=Pichia membranifaciens TaxID=4926 RepID=A0A1Q2YDA1_9ASCO|nr:hypothetical protein PMKS-001024 [Pichia membranifaciens]